MNDVQSDFHFVDENQLLEVVQLRVHGSRLMLLPGSKLLVSPLKRSAFSGEVLKKLVGMEMEQRTRQAGPELADRLWKAFGLLNGDALDDTILAELPILGELRRRL